MKVSHALVDLTTHHRPGLVPRLPHSGMGTLKLCRHIHIRIPESGSLGMRLSQTNSLERRRVLILSFDA